MGESFREVATNRLLTLPLVLQLEFNGKSFDTLVRFLSRGLIQFWFPLIQKGFTLLSILGESFREA